MVLKRLRLVTVITNIDLNDMVSNMDPETVALLISFWRTTARRVSPASERKKKRLISWSTVGAVFEWKKTLYSIKQRRYPPYVYVD